LNILGIEIAWYFMLVLAIPIALVILQLFKKFYVVVPPEQVHIVVNSKGKKAYQNRDGFKSTYWYFPWWMTRNVLPLEQIPISVSREKLSLHDDMRIPFRCDVVAWLVVKEPVIAAERVGNLMSEAELKHTDRQALVAQVALRLSRDIEPMICAVARTASFKTSLLDIMKDRAKFAKQVETDLDISLQEWGLYLTALEVLHIEDVPTSSVGGTVIRGVIKNWELEETKTIDTATRILISVKEKEAREIEALNRKIAEITVAENEELYRRAQISKDQNIAIAEQEKTMAIQEKTKEANLMQIAADREIAVGEAAYVADAKVKTAVGEKQAAIEKAEGDKEAKLRQAEGESEYTLRTGRAKAEITRVTGESEGDATRAKRTADADGERAMLVSKADGNKLYLLGEAEGLDKKADAQKKLQDEAVMIQLIEAAKAIEIAKYQYLADGIKGADTKIIVGGMAELFGNAINPAQGAGIGATLSSLINALPPELQTVINEKIPSLLKKETK